MATPALDAITVGVPEDRYTHVLWALLQDAKVAEAFMFRFCGVPDVRSARVTEQTRVDRGRADLQIVTPDLFVIVEVKVTAGPHGEQFRSYALEVGQHGEKGRLLILAPSGYLESLLQQAEAAKNSLDSPAFPIEGASWAQVRDLLRELARDGAVDSRTRVYLGDFADLVERHIERGLRPLSVGEIIAIRTSLIPDCWEIIDHLLRKSHELLEVSSPGWVLSNSATSYGWNAPEPLRNHQVWFGRWNAAWRLYGLSPLWVTSTPASPRWDSVADALDLPFGKSLDNDLAVPVGSTCRAKHGVNGPSHRRPGSQDLGRAATGLPVRQVCICRGDA
jgi:hypothetical protein